MKVISYIIDANFKKSNNHINSAEMLHYLEAISLTKVFWKIFEGEMFIKTKLKTILEIFDESVLGFRVTFRSIVDPDDIILIRKDA